MTIIAQVGQPLVGTPGTWTGVPDPSFTYQWYRAGLPISFASSLTYVPVVADIGSVLTFVVTATNLGGSAMASSLPTAAVTGGATTGFSTTYVALVNT